MWNILKRAKCGKYVYAYVPDHPNATKYGYVLEHRIVMENYLGRLLNKDEVVHHKDHDTKNNSIENLEVMKYKEHCKMHALEQGKNFALLKCPWCGKIFKKSRNNTHLVKPSKYNCTCCSNSCRGKLYRYIQLNGITDDIKRRMDENVVSITKEHKNI